MPRDGAFVLEQVSPWRVQHTLQHCHWSVEPSTFLDGEKRETEAPNGAPCKESQQASWRWQCPTGMDRPTGLGSISELGKDKYLRPSPCGIKCFFSWRSAFLPSFPLSFPSPTSPFSPYHPYTVTYEKINHTSKTKGPTIRQDERIPFACAQHSAETRSLAPQCSGNSSGSSVCWPPSLLLFLFLSSCGFTELHTPPSFSGSEVLLQAVNKAT